MTQLATADELEAHLRTQFDAQQTVQADQLLTLVSGAADTYCNKVAFTRQVDDVRTLDGTYDHDLVLPDGPVESVSAVAVNGTTVTDWTLRAGPITAKLVRSTASGVSGAGHWGGPLADVQVTYTHGFDGAPDDVKYVVLEAAARRWPNPEGVESEQYGDVSVSYVRDRDTGSQAIPAGLLGSLSRYRNTASSVQVS